LALFLNACTSGGPVLLGDSMTTNPEYIIGPGDSLNVFVYRAPELSVDVPVRPDGRISTPLVSDVVALGKSPSQLAISVQDELKKYVKDPNVTIMVTSFAGPPDRQIRVIVRQEPDGRKTYRVRLSDLLNDGDISQNLPMQPGDTLFVPQAWF
jgi:polysaccharide export outer membrane protein